MITTRPSVRRVVAGAAIAFLALGAAAGCSKSDDTSTGTTTTAASSGTTAGTSSPGTTTAANADTVKFDKTIQEQLKTVGCYSGAVDGIFGPQTDAAVIAFQEAEGLEVDGEVGPETEAALSKAAKAGTKVCTSAGTTTTTSGSAGSTTSTTTNDGYAPCTATAISAQLPSGNQVTAFVCSGEWAAATYTDSSGGGATKIIMESVKGVWQVPGQDPCGSASAGLPPVILEQGCPS